LAIAPDMDLIDRIRTRIETAIQNTEKREKRSVAGLVALLVAGLALLAYGAIRESIAFSIPGGLLGAVIVFPINWLLRIRSQCLALRALPMLLALAQSPRERETVFDLVVTQMKAGLK